MRMKQSKKSLSFIFCMMLIMAVALFTSGCNDKTTDSSVTAVESVQKTDSESGDSSVEGENAHETEVEEAKDQTEVKVLGEGENEFLFTVVDKEGMETAFEIHTDKKIVGEALSELGLVEGEESEYGLFVKSVNGIVADYEIDGTYWAFYVNGEYAMSGVDTTTIEEGTAYMFKVEK